MVFTGEWTLYWQFLVAVHRKGNFKKQDKKKSPGSSIGRAKL